MRKLGVFLALLLALFAPIGARAEEMPDVSNPRDIVYGAMEVYAWFEMSPLDVDWSQGNDENTLFRVLDERYNTLASLVACARATFSEEIVEALLAWETYVEIDGFLYDDGQWRAVDPRIADVVFDEAHVHGDEIIFPVTVYYLEDGASPSGPESIQFVMARGEAGWVFTEFPFFW